MGEIAFKITFPDFYEDYKLLFKKWAENGIEDGLKNMSDNDIMRHVKIEDIKINFIE